MAHYAVLNNKNIVVQVITGNDDNSRDWEQFYSNELNSVCKKTSKTKQFRKNYAGLGYRYDQELDAFIPPRPYASWILNTETCNWEAPVAKPTDGKLYAWNEGFTLWMEIK